MLAETQRLALLRAMGIDVFRLRAAGPPAAVPAAAAQATNVAVICGRDAVPARFKTQLPRALGIAQERLLWLDPGAAVPAAAAAYVVVGTEAARALGVQLSTMQQNTCVIAATAEAADLLHGAAAKRALAGAETGRAASARALTQWWRFSRSRIRRSASCARRTWSRSRR